ncbi:MAG: 5'-nucleotidase C-terminal domain-containing protein, partial [Fimbriimonadaceae bacterium]
FLLPSKGFEYTFNINAAAGKQLVSAKLNGVEIKDDQKYRVTVNNFTASGGDGHVILRDDKGTRIETGLLDLDALIDYFKANAPVKMTNEGRVKAIK